MAVHFLCEAEALADPGSQGFELTQGSVTERVFLVRKAKQLFAYRNICPHRGLALDWQPHQFLTEDGALIQCATHGALFAIESGLCLRGPCVGKSLEALPVLVREDGAVLVTLP